MVATTVDDRLERALGQVGTPFLVVADREGGFDLVEADADGFDAGHAGRTLGYLPACRPEALGDASFRAEHGVRFAYVSGAMANGIGSAEIVEAMGRAGMLGIYGAAGPAAPGRRGGDRPPRRVARPLDPLRLQPDPQPQRPRARSGRGRPLPPPGGPPGRGVGVPRPDPAGGPLPGPGDPPRRLGPGRGPEPGDRQGLAGRGRVQVPRPAARPVPPRAGRPRRDHRRAGRAGRLDPDGRRPDRRGRLGRPHRQPAGDRPPADHARPPRPAPGPVPVRPPRRVGAAGGISTPWSAASAFAMGASYVVVGSVNQACVESGTSDAVRKMLAQAQQADIAMAPAADMFEMGVKVQVLKRGTMFAMRAAKLLEYYRAYDSIEAIPAADRATLEKTYFKAPLESIWDQTRAYFLDRDPGAGRARRPRPQAQDGPGLPLVPRQGVALGQRRRPDPGGRLSGLVRPGDGGVQRVGQGDLPRRPRGAPGGDGGAEHPLSCGGAQPGPVPGRAGAGDPARRPQAFAPAPGGNRGADRPLV